MGAGSGRGAAEAPQGGRHASRLCGGHTPKCRQNSQEQVISVSLNLGAANHGASSEDTVMPPLESCHLESQPRHAAFLQPAWACRADLRPEHSIPPTSFRHTPALPFFIFDRSPPSPCPTNKGSEALRSEVGVPSAIPLAFQHRAALRLLGLRLGPQTQGGEAGADSASPAVRVQHPQSCVAPGSAGYR